jgi:hypothetical protein
VVAYMRTVRQLRRGQCRSVVLGLMDRAMSKHRVHGRQDITYCYRAVAIRVDSDVSDRRRLCLRTYAPRSRRSMRVQVRTNLIRLRS